MRKVPFGGWAKRDGPEDHYPRSGSCTVVTAGNSWAWSAYSQLTAATVTFFVPHLLVVNIRFIIAASAWVIGEYELAAGAGGFEVPFARVPFAAPALVAAGTGVQVFTAFNQLYPLGPDLLASGVRIAHRARIDHATAVANLTSVLMGHDGGKAPLDEPGHSLRGHLTGLEKGRTRCAPDGSAIAVTSGSAWAYGNWAQVIAAAPTDLLVWGAAISYANVVADITTDTMEIGTGALGSEVARMRLGFPRNAYCTASMSEAKCPLLVKKGERVSVRMATGAAGKAWNVVLFYEET